jgi:probable addiction module antidote protein
MKLSALWEPFKIEMLKDPESAALYIQAYLEEGDPLNECLADVIKAQGLQRMAKLTGIAAPNLLRATRRGSNPTVATLNAILDAMGMTLSVEAKKAKKSPQAPSSKRRRPKGAVLSKAA